MPKISVIMGVYNCKDSILIVNSVESIIKQTYTDWEFIICNDGSTDKTLEILKDIEQMDNRIHVLTYSQNKGLAYALNTCLEIACGEYIARQDFDDTSSKDRFEKQVSFLTENDSYSIVGSNATVFDDFGKWGTYEVPEKPDKYSFLWNCPFIHPSTMIRAESLKNVNGYRIANETRRCEDYDLFMRMYTLGCKGYNIQEELYNYRMIIDPNKKYRQMKYRIDETLVRYKGFRDMGIFIKGIPYIFKPIIIGIIPAKVFSRIRTKQYQ